MKKYCYLRRRWLKLSLLLSVITMLHVVVKAEDRNNNNNDNNNENREDRCRRYSADENEQEQEQEQEQNQNEDRAEDEQGEEQREGEEQQAEEEVQEFMYDLNSFFLDGPVGCNDNPWGIVVEYFKIECEERIPEKEEDLECEEEEEDPEEGQEVADEEDADVDSGNSPYGDGTFYNYYGRGGGYYPYGNGMYAYHYGGSSNRNYYNDPWSDQGYYPYGNGQYSQQYGAQQSNNQYYYSYGNGNNNGQGQYGNSGGQYYGNGNQNGNNRNYEEGEGEEREEDPEEGEEQPDPEKHKLCYLDEKFKVYGRFTTIYPLPRFVRILARVCVGYGFPCTEYMVGENNNIINVCDYIKDEDEYEYKYPWGHWVEDEEGNREYKYPWGQWVEDEEGNREYEYPEAEEGADDDGDDYWAWPTNCEDGDEDCQNQQTDDQVEQAEEVEDDQTEDDDASNAVNEYTRSCPAGGTYYFEGTMRLPYNITEYMNEYTRRLVLRVTFQPQNGISKAYEANMQYQKYLRNGGSYNTEDGYWLKGQYYPYEGNDDDATDDAADFRSNQRVLCHAPLHVVRENFNMTEYHQRSTLYTTWWAYLSSLYASDFWIANGAAFGALAGLFVWRRRRIQVSDTSPPVPVEDDTYIIFEMELPALGSKMQVV